MHELASHSTPDDAMREPPMQPHRRARPRYTLEEKLEIVHYAQTHSVKAACDRYGVARSSIHLWSAREEHLMLSVRGQQRQRQSTTVTSIRAPDIAAQHPAPTAGSPIALAEEHHLATARASVVPAKPLGNQSHGASPAVPSRGSARAPNPVLIGYQGTEGSFSHAAVQRTFARVVANGVFQPEAIEPTGYPQVPHVLDALSRQEIEYAVASTDVLLSNVQHAALDRLVMLHLTMVAEVMVTESVSVCALPGTKLCDADCVISDVSTLQRYEEYVLHIESLYGKKIYRQATWDSAAGCALIEQERAHNTVVLCKASAALAHGLVVLQEQALGSPSRARYTVLAQRGQTPVGFAYTPRQMTVTQQIRHCTLLVKSTGRAILDVVSAFAYRGLDIITFYTRGSGDERGLPSYVISYRASADPAVEAGLRTHLVAAAERVIVLGNYSTFTL